MARLSRLYFLFPSDLLPWVGLRRCRMAAMLSMLRRLSEVAFTTHTAQGIDGAVRRYSISFHVLFIRREERLTTRISPRRFLSFISRLSLL